jgi:hypothetical protein
MSKMQVKKGNALAAAFKGKSSGEEKFGFGFIANPELNPEDIANELIAEAENAEKNAAEKNDVSAAPKKKKKKKKKTKKKVPSEAEDCMKESQDDEEVSNDDELDQAMILFQQKDDKIAKSALAKLEKKTETDHCSKKTIAQPLVKEKASPEGHTAANVKKTRRGKRSKKKREAAAQDKAADSDEDWYDPQPQELPQELSQAASNSNDSVRFVSGARATGRSLVARGPVKVRNNAWARGAYREGAQDKGELSLAPAAPVPDVLGDSPFSFGFQLSI